jgi:RNA polymerase sigma-70 factor (ECF subfamily)
VAIDARRRRARRPQHETLDEDSALAPTITTSPAHAIEQREALAAAEAAVAGLGDAEKQVFLLRVGGELSFDAVARTLAIPVGTAKTRMRSALMKLRSKLGAGQANEENTR